MEKRENNKTSKTLSSQKIIHGKLGSTYAYVGDLYGIVAKTAGSHITPRHFSERSQMYEVVDAVNGQNRPCKYTSNALDRQIPFPKKNLVIKSEWPCYLRKPCEKCDRSGNHKGMAASLL